MIETRPKRKRRYGTIERRARSVVNKIDLERREIKISLYPMVLIASEVVRSIADRKPKEGTEIQTLALACGYLEQKVRTGSINGKALASRDFMHHFENCIRIGLKYELFDPENIKAQTIGRDYVTLAALQMRGFNNG